MSNKEVYAVLVVRLFHRTAWSAVRSDVHARLIIRGELDGRGRCRGAPRRSASVARASTERFRASNGRPRQTSPAWCGLWPMPLFFAVCSSIQAIPNEKADCAENVTRSARSRAQSADRGCLPEVRVESGVHPVELLAIYGAEYPLPTLLDHLGVPGARKSKASDYVSPIDGRERRN